MRKFAAKMRSDNQNTHFLFDFFPQNRAVYMR